MCCNARCCRYRRLALHTTLLTTYMRCAVMGFPEMDVVAKC